MSRKLETVQKVYDGLVEEFFKVQNSIKKAFKEKDIREVKKHWKKLTIQFNSIFQKLYEELKEKGKK